MISTVGQLFAAAFAGLGFYFLALFFFYKWKYRHFRGPMALPVIGNFQVLDKKGVSLIGFLSKQRRQIGNIFVFFGLWHARLIICDPFVVRRILSDPKAFPKGKDYTERFAVIFGAGLVTSNGEKHKHDRSIFSKYFIRSNIVKMAKLMNEIADSAIDDLIKKCSSPRGKSVNVEHFCAIIALRVFMMFSINCDLRTQPERENAVCKAVSAASLAAGRSILFGTPGWLTIHPDIAQMDRTANEVIKDFNAILVKRKAAIANGDPEGEVDDCLAAMIKENMSPKDMKDHFVTLISAGHDTTAYFMAYVLLLLAQYPKVQDRLREEVRTHMKGRTEVTPDDVAEITYLAKVLFFPSNNYYCFLFKILFTISNIFIRKYYYYIFFTRPLLFFYCFTGVPRDSAFLRHHPQCRAYLCRGDPHQGGQHHYSQGCGHSDSHEHHES